MSQVTGKVAQIIGPVVDVEFASGSELPKIYDSLEVNNNGNKLILEVQSHMGENTVRTISMDSTDGLSRGVDAVATGAPIQMPIGDDIYGRSFNVIGDPIDHSLSPNIHSAAFRELNLDSSYIGYRIPKGELEGGVEGLKKIKITGFNVTIPHKIEMMKYLDKNSNNIKLFRNEYLTFHLGNDNNHKNSSKKEICKTAFEIALKQLI